MKKSSSIILIMLLAFAAIAVMTVDFAVAQTSPTITTDKADYGPAETVVITGTDFLHSSSVELTLSGPLGFTTYTWTEPSDNDGNFQTSYSQGLMEGTFTLQATDGTNPTAETTFTDKTDKDIHIKAETGGTITYSPVGTGTGTVSEGELSDFTIESGTKITFTAEPKSGYIFAFWSGDDKPTDVTENPYQVEVGNAIGNSQPLTANFVPATVVPEYSFGALAALGACFVGLGLFKNRRSLPHFKRQ